MVEHNAVIYVYCDFNLKPPRRHRTSLCKASVQLKECMCALGRLAHNEIDESIRYHGEN